jgi:hypothetical protein
LDGAYCRVTQVALGDGLEKRGLANVCQPNLFVRLVSRAEETEITKATHNAALQVVSGTTQKDLLLLDLLLGSHLVAFAVLTSGDVDEGAVKQRLGKRRTSCGGSKEG